MLHTREEVEQHIRYKANVRELREDVAHEMLVLLASGAEPDYRALYLAVVRKPLAEIAFHSAPSEFRESIQQHGLRMALPSDGRWNMNAHGQPRAVYLGPEPDERGRWATTDEWDIWEVRTEGLEWQHDPINESCWAVTQDIAPDRIRLVSTQTRHWP